jgi:hypothetical protein
LPKDWESRLQRIQNEGTNGRVGYCLDVIDLFMAKAVANREKDRDFNMALLRHGLVSVEQAVAMVEHMPVEDAQMRDLRARIRRWAKFAAAG